MTEGTIIYKRLSNGKFQWPRSEAELKLLDPQSFHWLMEGLHIEQKTATVTLPYIIVTSNEKLASNLLDEPSYDIVASLICAVLKK